MYYSMQTIPSLLAFSEDDSQRAMHNLKQAVPHYSMEISVEKSNVMNFCEKYPVQSKICIMAYWKE